MQAKWAALALALVMPWAPALASDDAGAAGGGPEQKTGFTIVPGPFYNPSQGLGLMVIPMATFRISQDDAVSPPSIAALPLMYSVLPPLDEAGTRYSVGAGLGMKLYLDEDRWRVNGIVGYASVFRLFRGIGGDVTATPSFDYREQAVLALVQVMRQAGWRPFYLGLVGGYVTFRNRTSAPENQAILDSLGTGSDWNGQPNLGLATQIDTKNNQYYPSAGLDFNLRMYGSPESGQQYIVLEPNLNQFFSIAGGKRLVLAYRLFGQLGFGDVPLSYYAYYGSHGTTVGYSSGDYVDKMMAGVDAELRWLFWWRVGLLGGAGVGKVFPSFDGFGPQPWLPSGWAGLLYEVLEESDVRVNLTLAVGKDDTALYFGIGQTF